MASVNEIMQLCRLCLVKEEVNVPIFEEQGDLRQIFLKISACLPVKVSREDNLPKSICDGCSCKLEMFYQFWNTSTNSEKKLIKWLNQGGIDKPADKTSQHSMNIDPMILKQEVIEVADNQSSPDDLVPDDLNVSNDAQDYILQQQQLPYQNVEFQFQQDGFEETTTDEVATTVETEAPPTRKRRAAAMRALANMESEDEDDVDLIDTKIAKTEEQSDDSVGEDPEPTTFVGLPSATDNEQPGPSGVGKTPGDAPIYGESNSIIGRLVYGPSMSVTVCSPPEIKQENTYDSYCEINDTQNLLYMQVPEEKEVVNPGSTTSVLPLKRAVKERRAAMKETQKSKKDNPEAIHCEICEKNFRNNLSFGLHSIKHNNKYSCHICEYKTVIRNKFERHIKIHEGTNGYKCEMCDKHFAVANHALEHRYFHTGEKPFQCDVCGKHFTYSRFLNAHYRSQHCTIQTGQARKQYTCTLCDKHYISCTGLTRHQQRHHTVGFDQSKLCDICGKRLASRDQLKFHRRIHTGDKPYSCEVCSKSFTRKDLLREHERVHTGERPYTCQYCNKCFTQRSPLKIHERTHTGERPFECLMCKKTFIAKGILGAHMKKCQGIKDSK